MRYGMVFSVPCKAMRSRSSVCPTRPLSRVRAQLLQAAHLALIALRIHFQDGDGQRFLFGIGIHADDPADALVDLALIAIGRIGDLALEESLFDGGDHAAQLLDAAEVVVGLLLDAVGLRLDEEAAAERIDRVRHARLFGDDLLGAQGNRHCMFGGQRQRLIQRIGMQALRAAEDGGQSLDGHTDHIVLRLLCGEARRRPSACGSAAATSADSSP